MVGSWRGGEPRAELVEGQVEVGRGEQGTQTDTERSVSRSLARSHLIDRLDHEAHPRATCSGFIFY